MPSILASCLILALSGPLWGSVDKLLAPLSKEEKRDLDLQNMIFKTQKVKQAPWPRVEILQVIEATPLQAVAVFAAYEYQKEYVPNLILSKVVKIVSPVEIHTQYEIKMPWPLPNGKYVNGHILEKLGDQSYRVKWYKVSSNSAEEVEGAAEFYPYKGKTLMFYNSYVYPKSMFASLIRGFFLKDTKASIEATVKYTGETLKNSQKTTRFIGLIEKALSGKKPY